MKKAIKTIQWSIILAVFASGASASGDCYIDYKAKRTSGDLQLHYGVMKLSGAACNSDSARQGEATSRLAEHNWTLLRIVSVLDESGLNQRQEDAGEFYLKY